MVSKLIFLLILILFFTLPAWGQTLTNGNCESATVTWGAYGGASEPIRNAGAKRSGTYGCAIVLAATDSGMYQSVADLTIGSSYLVTAWVKGVNLDTGVIIVDLGNSGQGVVASNDVWTKIEFSKIAEGTDLNLIIFVTAGNDTKIFYVDDVTIVAIPTGIFGGGNMTGGIN